MTDPTCPADPRAPVHGTRSRYRKGCHDECCRAPERAYKRLWRARRARAGLPAR